MSPAITLHWLGGWASSLVCWEPMLRERFPEFDHRFLDTHVLLDKSLADAGLLFEEGIRENKNIVVAWSMGSLLTHLWIDQGRWPQDLPLLSLCPVFRFTKPGGFGEPILVRMGKKIGAEREMVLRDFWRRMPGAQKIPAVWEEKWMEGTRGYSNQALIRGLEFLRGTTAKTLPAFPPLHWELLAGKNDLLAPAPEAESLSPKAHCILYEGGHLPFWECPDEIQASLKRLLAQPGYISPKTR